jgi:hypothetical protein
MNTYFLSVTMCRYIEICIDFLKLSFSSWTKYEVESRLWKLGFYTPIETIRRFIATSSAAIQASNDTQPVAAALTEFAEDREEVSAIEGEKEACWISWGKLLDFGEETMRNVVSCLKSSPKASSSSSPSLPPWALAVAKMGDICRYRSVMLYSNQSKDKDHETKAKEELQRAKEHYKRAALLSPNNGMFRYHNLVRFCLAFETLCRSSLSSTSHVILATGKLQKPFLPKHSYGFVLSPSCFECQTPL